MFNKRTTALLFVALLVCGTFAYPSNVKPSYRSNKMSNVYGTSTLRGHKNQAIINPQILVRKSRGNGSSKKSAPVKSSCAPAPQPSCKPAPSCGSAPHHYTVTVKGQKTLFNDTWETIGYCTRTWQQVKEVQTTVDYVSVHNVCVDTINQEKVNWQVISERKANQKVVRRVRTHIQVLKPKKIEYQTLVAKHVQYQDVCNQQVCVQTIAQRSACVGELANKKVNQRIIKEQKACARTLAPQKVAIKKVKKVNEQVSQLINTTSACLGIRNGVSIHNHSSVCAPVKSYCAPVKSAPKKSVC